MRTDWSFSGSTPSALRDSLSVELYRASGACVTRIGVILVSNSSAMVALRMHSWNAGLWANLATRCFCVCKACAFNERDLIALLAVLCRPEAPAVGVCRDHWRHFVQRTGSAYSRLQRRLCAGVCSIERKVLALRKKQAASMRNVVEVRQEMERLTWFKALQMKELLSGKAHKACRRDGQLVSATPATQKKMLLC